MNEIEKHLKELGEKKLLPQVHSNYLSRIKNYYKFVPEVVYDIGACVLHWTNEAKQIWPTSNFYCFEAMPEVEFIFKDSDIAGYNIGVLSDTTGNIVKFYQNNFFPGGNSYYRENPEFNSGAEHYFNESHIREYTTYTLDDVIKNKNFPLPDLIKIDVQGAELDVLKGADICLQHTKHLIMELQKVEYNKGAPHKDIIIDYIRSKGFILVDDNAFSDNGPDGDYHFIK